MKVYELTLGFPQSCALQRLDSQRSNNKPRILTAHSVDPPNPVNPKPPCKRPLDSVSASRVQILPIEFWNPGQVLRRIEKLFGKF